MTSRTKLATAFAVVWIISVVIFLFVSFSSTNPDGLYTKTQNIILVSSVGVGIFSFLSLVFCLGYIYRKKRDDSNVRGNYNKSQGSDTRKEKYLKENNKRCEITNKYLIAFTWLIIGLLGGFYGSNYYYRIIKIDSAYIEVSSYTDMVRLINKERVAAGLNPLTENKLLDESAKAKACDMRDNNYFEHISPDGKQPWYFIKKAGYDYYHAGENIARDYNNSTKRTATAYMNSEEHRDNILDPTYTEVGIGQCGVYSVEHFANHQ